MKLSLAALRRGANSLATRMPLLPYRLLATSLVLLIGGLGVMLVRDLSPAATERGWKARERIPAFTRIDPTIVAWSGEGADAAEMRRKLLAIDRRLTVRVVAKDSMVREAALAAPEVDTRNRWLVRVPADSALLLRSGAEVVLVASRAKAGTPPDTVRGQVVIADSGQLVVALRPDRATTVAQARLAGRLAVLRTAP